MMTGYGLLALSALASALGLVAQTVAARSAERRAGVDPGLLGRLVTDRVYLLGFGAQVAGFVLAFLARETLPLYLVQAGSSAAVGLAAVIGLVALGWRISSREALALAVLAAGLLLLVGAAESSVATDPPGSIVFWLLGALTFVGALTVPAARLPGARGAVALGALAGVAFAVVAVAGRPLAAGSLLGLPLQPLAWLMVGAAVLGQALLAMALQRASTTAAAASMDATTVVLGALIGLAVLGDRIAEGRAAWVAAGLALVVLAVVAMAVTGRVSRTRPPAEPVTAPMRTVPREATT